MRKLIRVITGTVGGLAMLKLLPILSGIVQVDMGMTFIFVTTFIVIYDKMEKKNGSLS